MSNYTKGPWKVETYRDDLEIWNKSNVKICDIAIMHMEEQDNEANAALIASAPEMLEALEHALESFTEFTTTTDQHFKWSDTIATLKIAINKAKGGA